MGLEDRVAPGVVAVVVGVDQQVDRPRRLGLDAVEALLRGVGKLRVAEKMPTLLRSAVNVPFTGGGWPCAQRRPGASATPAAVSADDSRKCRLVIMSAPRHVTKGSDPFVPK
jgi:hypothetical protein